MLLIFFRGTQKEIFIRNCSENILCSIMGKKNAANSLEEHWIGSFLFWRKIMVTFSCFFFICILSLNRLLEMIISFSLIHRLWPMRIYWLLLLKWQGVQTFSKPIREIQFIQESWCASFGVPKVKPWMWCVCVSVSVWDEQWECLNLLKASVYLRSF